MRDHNGMICSSKDHNTRNCSTMYHNTRDRSTRDHNTMCVSTTSSGHPSNGPNIRYPKVYHHTERSKDDRSDGTGTDDESGNSPRLHHCNLRHKSRRSPHGCLHISYHVYIRLVHRPELNRPHTVSDWFRKYNGGYTHRDHGLL